MKKYTIRLGLPLLFGTAVVLVGCLDAETPKANPPPVPSSSVGREYGETLRGAIDQANKAKSTLEESGKTLDHAADVSK